MAGLPFDRMGPNRMVPETMLDEYLQRGLDTRQQDFNLGYGQIYGRSSLGYNQKKTMLDNLQLKAMQGAATFRQEIESQRQQFAELDQLAKQGGFDPYEAKMRILLGPEAEAAAFPKQEVQRPLSMSELQGYEAGLTKDFEDFVQLGGGGKKIKKWYLPEKYEKLAPTEIFKRVYGPTDKKTTWIGEEGREKEYTRATPADIRNMRGIQEQLDWVRDEKTRLSGLPDYATRIRGAMLHEQRDKNMSLNTRVENSKEAAKPKPKQDTPRPEMPSAEALLQASKGMKKGSKERQELFNLGVSLGYWE